MSIQSVPLHHLPVRSLSAAANMAVDNLLLEQYPQPDAPRFRHYGWADPAFTFGRTQNYEDARCALPVHVSWQDAHERFASAFQLVRRPTGGGIVDHRSDWTYALVIPASHPLFRATARDVYRDCHRVLAEALAEQGVQAELAPCPQECSANTACAAGGAESDSTPDDSSVNTDTHSAAVDFPSPADGLPAGTDPSSGSTDTAPTSTDTAPTSTDTAPTGTDTAPASADASPAGTGSVNAGTDPAPTDSIVCSEGASAPAASVCFTHAEPYDVVGEGGVKLAGAAQRRSREGLLVQGSVSRAEVGGINWQRFEQDVAEGFARYLVQSDGLGQPTPQPSSVLIKEVAFPKWGSTQLQEQIARFSSSEWNCRR